MGETELVNALIAYFSCPCPCCGQRRQVTTLRELIEHLGPNSGKGAINLPGQEEATLIYWTEGQDLHLSKRICGDLDYIGVQEFVANAHTFAQ